MHAAFNSVIIIVVIALMLMTHAVYLVCVDVEAQSTLGRGQDIFARKYMYEKLTKCWNFT